MYDEFLPLIFLKKLFEIDEGANSEPENGFIVVDGVLHIAGIVLKLMSTELRHIGMFLGKSTVGLRLP